ncbi:MAG TPA: GTP 3',8-cyclase MoaA [Balneolales bacterium]|nr:GTP 3',8-cyclase MoaA [Balneolales bacterium]
MTNHPLLDPHGRVISYLRLSVTDRCNFRCQYCMPEEGMHFVARDDLLTFEELHHLSEIFCRLGITKIRVTGGEPFVRKEITTFLRKLRSVDGLEKLTITTNGTLLQQYVNELKEIGIDTINLSLDSLNRERFYQITRRDKFDEVYSGIFKLLDTGFELKINCVLMKGKNEEDIVPFIELTKNYPISVRFLEEMPFNGSESFDSIRWDYKEIYSYINAHYPDIENIASDATSTSENYRIPGYKGSFGIIASFSRTFCGTCNRIRLSATGDLRTCLYGPPVINLRDVMRMGASTDQLELAIINAVRLREKDGYAAEALNKRTVMESMSVLGG